ncbi:olfactory receptor 14A16-like [Liasis olivaceus]
MSGNLSIIFAVVLDYHLHTPMYFFLMNLAMLDLGSISVTVPKSMANSLLSNRSISYSGCVAQVFFYVFFAGSDLALLTVMAYDRYIAICNPLHYETVLNKKACIRMATSAWMGGLFYSMLYTGNVFTVEFCSRIIDQFFCEIPQLLKISCSDSYLPVVWVVFFGSCLAFLYFAPIVFSYVQIFRAVLRIPSTQGKQKVFSTCLPHLFVTCLFLVSGTFAYLRPTTSSLSASNILISLFYCVLPPVMNPLIYSMRNKELKMAFWKLIFTIFPHTLRKYSQLCVF